jgi:hypothetical protein
MINPYFKNHVKTRNIGVLPKEAYEIKVLGRF